MNPKTIHVYFLFQKPADPDIKKLREFKSKKEKFVLKDNVFYLFAPDGIGRSKLAAKVEKLLGVPLTARNWNTAKKIFELAGSK